MRTTTSLCCVPYRAIVIVRMIAIVCFTVLAAEGDTSYMWLRLFPGDQVEEWIGVRIRGRNYWQEEENDYYLDYRAGCSWNYAYPRELSVVSENYTVPPPAPPDGLKLKGVIDASEADAAYDGVFRADSWFYEYNSESDAGGYRDWETLFIRIQVDDCANERTGAWMPALSLINGSVFNGTLFPAESWGGIQQNADVDVVRVPASSHNNTSFRVSVTSSGGSITCHAYTSTTGGPYTSDSGASITLDVNPISGNDAFVSVQAVSGGHKIKYKIEISPLGSTALSSRVPKPIRWVNYSEPKPKGDDADKGARPAQHPVVAVNNVTRLPSVSVQLFPARPPYGGIDMTPVLTYSPPALAKRMVGTTTTYTLSAPASLVGHCWCDNLSPSIERNAGEIVCGSLRLWELTALVDRGPVPPASFFLEPFENQAGMPGILGQPWKRTPLTTAKLTDDYIGYWPSGLILTNFVDLHPVYVTNSINQITQRTWYTWPESIYDRNGNVLSIDYGSTTLQPPTSASASKASDSSDVYYDTGDTRIRTVETLTFDSQFKLALASENDLVSSIIQLRDVEQTRNAATIVYEDEPTTVVNLPAPLSDFSINLIKSISLPDGTVVDFEYTDVLDGGEQRYGAAFSLPYLSRVLTPCDTTEFHYVFAASFDDSFNGGVFGPDCVTMVSCGGGRTDTYQKVNFSVGLTSGSAEMKTKTNSGTENRKIYDLRLDTPSMQWLGFETLNTLDEKQQHLYDYDHLKSLRCVSAADSPDGGQTWFTNTFAYDVYDNLLRASDPLGNNILYSYAPNGCDLTRTVNALGMIVSNEFDAYGNVTATIEDCGEWSIPHDTNMMYTDPLVRPGACRFTSNQYNTAGQLIVTIDPEGRVTRNYYEQDGQPGNPGDYTSVEPTTTARGYLVATRDPENRVATFTYDAAGRQVTVNSPGPGASRYIIHNTYDQLDRLTSTTYDSDDTYVSYHYVNGYPVLVRDRAGRYTTNTYDAAGHLLRVDYPNGDSVRKEYVGDMVTKVVDGRGNVTRYHYDHEQLVGVEFPDGTKRAAGFDILNRQLWAVDERGVAVTNTYDALGRVVFSQYTGFDLAFEALDHTRYPFGTFAFPLAEDSILPAESINHALTLAYDPVGNLVSRNDWVADKAYAYDGLNRVTNVLTLDGEEVLSVMAYSYDNANNCTGRILSVSGVSLPTFHSFDPLNRLAGVKSFNETSAAYTYNSNGKIGTLTLGVGSPASTVALLSYSYDSNNRLSAINADKGQDSLLTLGYTYNSAQQITQILQRAHAAGYRCATNAYEYDARDQVSVEYIASTLGFIFNSNVYDRAQNRTRLLTVTNGTPGKLHYDYMAANKLTALYRPTDGFDLIFDDDRLSLDEEVLHGTDPTKNDTDDDGLDDGAEVLDWNTCPWKKDSDGDGIIDGSDQRPLFPDGCAWFVGQPEAPYEPQYGTYTMLMLPHLPPRDIWVERRDKPFYQYPYGVVRVRYEYDTAGNVTTCHVGDVKTVFRYNAQNKLSLVNYNNNAAVYEFLYDSENHRVAVSNNCGYWRYDLHDGNICIASVENDTITRFFVRGAGVAEGTGDVIVEIENPTASPVRHYYVPNHRGDTVLTLDSGGTVESWHRYDGFGNARRDYGSFTPRYTFSTKEHLPEPNLYLYAYRVYDPVSGRWTQRDPLDYYDSVNLYAFCGNGPVGAVDIFGLAVYAVWVNGHSKNPFGHAIVKHVDDDTGTVTYYDVNTVRDANGKDIRDKDGNLVYQGNKYTEEQFKARYGKATTYQEQKLEDISDEQACVDELEGRSGKSYPYEKWNNNCVDYANDAFKKGGHTVTTDGSWGEKPNRYPSDWIDGIRKRNQDLKNKAK